MWIKKHWNDPITVGGLTKFNIWCTVIGILSALAWIGIIWIRWFGVCEKIGKLWSDTVNKLKKVKTEEDMG